MDRRKLVQVIIYILAFFGSVSSILMGDYGVLVLVISIAVTQITLIISAVIGETREVQDDFWVPPNAQMPPPPPPPPAPIREFVCKECGKKFDTEKKARRHYGMAHYDKIQI